MNIIIPMAGKGTRFATCGFKAPKPLIKILNKPMYRYAVNSLPLNLASKIIFILRKSEYIDSLIADIEETYSSFYPCSIIALDYDTKGQAETVLQGISELSLNQPILVHNCDTCLSPDIKWSDMLKHNIDGAMVLFKSDEDKWSYAKLNINQSSIIKVQEKKIISHYASTGTYFFKDPRQFINDLQTLVKKNLLENNEYYISTVYNLMLEQQKKIVPIFNQNILCFGTPSDLVESLNLIMTNTNYEYFFKL